MSGLGLLVRACWKCTSKLAREEGDACSYERAGAYVFERRLSQQLCKHCFAKPDFVPGEGMRSSGQRGGESNSKSLKLSSLTGAEHCLDKFGCPLRDPEDDAHFKRWRFKHGKQFKRRKSNGR